MITRQKNLRAYLRGWCARSGVAYSRNVWVIRRHAGK